MSLRAAVLVMLLSTGFSLPLGWPDPDIRAGSGPSDVGVRVRRPQIRPAGPRCPIPKALSEAIDRRRPDQVLLVVATGTRARVVGCERVHGHWLNGERVDGEWVDGERAGYLRVLGPFPARVGRRGVAAPGAKREGDGRTPAGVFLLGRGFGTAKNPGLASEFGWFKSGRADVWVDDPASELYNSHQRAPANGRWRSAEKLRIGPYRTAQVIGYNRAGVPGRGSAIFLHRDTGRATAGCVSLRARQLRAVMQWERAGAMIAISRKPAR